MARVGNAFKYKVADVQIVDTSFFLQLYSPSLLGLLKPDDLHVPKLLVLRGSPGAGKSSLLRLFECDSLLALKVRKRQQSDQQLVDSLVDLGAWDDKGPKVAGLYIHCDSSLRDVGHRRAGGAKLPLLNTLIDVRVTALFIRAIEQLSGAGLLPEPIDKLVFPPLAGSDSPPDLFSRSRPLPELRDICRGIETDFAKLLNSFPGEPLPASIQPHARVFCIPYLGHVVNTVESLKHLIPLVMLDDFHVLSEDQRQHIRDEMLRRGPIPRWISVRKHVYGLEDLIPLEGAKDNRDYREIDLDSSPPGAFHRFLSNVTQRRLHQCDSLQDYSFRDFQELLANLEPTVDASKASRAITEINERIVKLSTKPTKTEPFKTTSALPMQELLAKELRLILAERSVGKQLMMFPEMEAPEPSDSKTEEAARLFLTKRAALPYYHSFDSLETLSNGNVEQFLSIVGDFAEKMIFRAEMGRNATLTAKEQEDLIKHAAQDYYDRIEYGFPLGYNIRQLIDNLGRFFEAVTYRPSAPIAPGVNGFGLTREELREAFSKAPDSPDLKLLKAVLTNAIAWNILFIRLTKQGEAGSEKVVFYFNRLLCVHYRLPLNTGGWQRLPIDTLVKMMKKSVEAADWGKKWVVQAIPASEG